MEYQRQCAIGSYDLGSVARIHGFKFSYSLPAEIRKMATSGREKKDAKWVRIVEYR